MAQVCELMGDPVEKGHPPGEASASMMQGSASTLSLDDADGSGTTTSPPLDSGDEEEILLGQLDLNCDDSWPHWGEAELLPCNVG